MPEPDELSQTTSKATTPDDSAGTGAADDTSAGTTPRLGPKEPARFGPPAESGEVGTLGPYRVVKALGTGAMGAVYLATDTRLNRRLALKVMLPEVAVDPAARERFLREARAAAQLSHDHVVTIYEADERDGMPFIAMQLLHGESLDAFLAAGGKPDLRFILRVAHETALALSAAHSLGLVHRDIKPANLWLEGSRRRVKVLDFGLAKQIGTDGDLTRTGVPLGTPRYMSPEQARGQKMDARTDLFSLGSVLYRLCTGKPPFDGEHVMAVLMALGLDEPAPVRELNPDMPETFAELIHQLLAKNLTSRVQTADEIVERVEAILEQLNRPAPVIASPPPPPPAPESQPEPEPVPLSPVERLATGDVTIEELLELRTDPRAEIPLLLHAERIWPAVKAAALVRPDVRQAFRDFLAQPEHVAELWDEAASALLAGDRRAWSSRWTILREVARDQAKHLLTALLADEQTVRGLQKSTQHWGLILLACADVGIPIPTTPEPPRSNPVSPPPPPAAPARSTPAPLPAREKLLELARDSNGVRQLWDEAIEALLEEDFVHWDTRWSVLRERAPGEAKKLLQKLVSREKNEARFLKLSVDVRSRFRAACADVQILPPGTLLLPVALGELEPLLASPPEWVGYIALVVMGKEEQNWLPGFRTADRQRMRKRVQEFLLAAPISVLTAYVSVARPHLDTDPELLTVLFKPHSPQAEDAADKLLSSDVLEPEEWLKLVESAELTQGSWSEFLLEQDHLANLLIRLGGEGAGEAVWGAYLDCLTPTLLSPEFAEVEGGSVTPLVVHEWERNVHRHLKLAAEQLAAAGVELALALPKYGVRKLSAANNLLRWIDDPSSAERDAPEEVGNACSNFGLDQSQLVEAAFRTGGFDLLDPVSELKAFGPLAAIFKTCFPVDQSFHTAARATREMIRLSRLCPEGSRGEFQVLLLRECVWDGHYRGLLQAHWQEPPHPRVLAWLTEYVNRPAPKKRGWWS